jgi:alpha-galactosidase
MRTTYKVWQWLVVLGLLAGMGLWGGVQKAGSASDVRPEHAAGPAPTPPMGWNSYDCYCGDVTEQEVKANADYLAQHLARFGWKYVVVDYYWYFLHPRWSEDQEKWEVTMDEYGRLLPALNRFPSAANGQGFKPLADYVHSKGLKFGIHIMRGIPRAAVVKNLPILGTPAHAKDVADTANDCSWSTAMHGVDVSKPAGQAYYDSMVALYAVWGVDFIKADDMSRGDKPAGREDYHGAEIAALSRAIRKAGRPIVLSLSPGETPVGEAAHVAKYAQMWRISDDFWDDWKLLKNQFLLCRAWAPYVGPNHWPDADMLPLGRLRIREFDEPERQSRLTPAEQRTHLTLWVIFRSPLMMGGDLPSLDAATLALLTNPEVLAVDQHSAHNRELFTRGSQVAWTADVPASLDKYLAVFNLDDRAPAEISVRWSELGLKGKCAVRDLWQKKDLGVVEDVFAPRIQVHGAGLYRVKPAP